ncbi:uncharacterized protein LOC126681916 [Mercurialis annua]|uniref:uncharacterized protein LOC126681916 n=1 Tax=Mercurialis annua TaxID=3986 RepID=UPI00215E554C|nr:uncharacterized protein LOC126681916 [Mercurialis annua]
MEDDRYPTLNHDGVIPPPPHDGLALNRANERVVPHLERRTLGEFFLPNVDNANYGCYAPPILANNFEIKPGTIQLLESRCQFNGLEREDPNAHLSKFTEQLAQAFLNKYFSMGKTARMTKEIIDFLQLHGESLYQVWERFKELQRNCPHHHLGREHLVSIFYNGTNESTRATIDAASGGSLMKKTYDEANNLLEELVTNSCSWSTERLRQPSQKGIMTLKQTQEFKAMKAKNATLLAQLEMYKQQANQRNAQLAVVQMGCETCDGHNHSGMDCPVLHQNSNEDNSGQAHANPNMGGANFQGGNRGPPNQGNFNNYRPQHPPGCQQNRNADEGRKIDKLIEEVRAGFKNQASVNHHLETQISQLAISLQNRVQGGLPSTTESNPREQVKAIELRSGKELDYPHASKEKAVDLTTDMNEEEVTELPYVKPPPPPPFVPKVPFPGRLKKTPDNQKFYKFLEIFKKLKINICFADALREMPQYAKFLKEIITKKQSWDDKGTISLTENSNIDDASIGGPLTQKPYGVVEDVLVKVDKFIFPVDFVVLDYAADKTCPMILGRPFMNTGKALIDVHAGRLTLRIDDDKVEFDMKRIMRNTFEEEECMRLDMIDGIVEELFPVSKVTFHSDETHETTGDEYSKEDEPKAENLIRRESVTPPSSITPPKVERKTLPSHLRYAFLGDNMILPIIISINLSETQEARVVKVVKQHILEINWQISDIRGISPSVVMHKIHLERESRASA